MTSFSKHSARDLSYSLLGPEYMPIGEAEMALRDAASPPRHYRFLKSGEIELLNQYGNHSSDWGSVLVADPFYPHFVQRSRFHGLVRLAGFENVVLEADGLRLPAGIFDSTLVSCDVGRNVVLDRIGYLAHVCIADEAVLLDVGSFLTTPAATFGNGIARDGERQRLRIEVANENGGRAVLPFAGMRIADAWLWARHPEDRALLDRLTALTDEMFDPAAGHYSRVGERAVITGARTIVDVQVGPHARIRGANRVRNVTMLSDEREPSTIAEGAEVENAILGHGARIGYGVKARSVVLGARARLEDGARCFHTVLGDNSTIACCETLHNLIFPFHEQHHNNSFLIASTVLGQSNIAAGETLGSNHNSRAPDGEVLAGRGFWPGLCTDFKHNCRFASWTLLAKGRYPAEINLPLPFSLVMPGEGSEGLQVFPAWWFLHNMYAIQRNGWKFRDRDKRIHAGQHIESDPLAPDTIEEIMLALERLEVWAGHAALRQGAIHGEDIPHEAALARGYELLAAGPDALNGLEIPGEGIENSRRPARVLKAAEAWAIYRDMAHHYAMRMLIGWMEEENLSDFRALSDLFAVDRERRWVNMGGQLVAGSDFDALRQNMITGGVASWNSVHAEYDRLWSEYPAARARHAAAILLALNAATPDDLNDAVWAAWLRRAQAIQERIAELVHASRAKDYANAFRHITFDSREQMDSVLGPLEDNAFIRKIREETEEFDRHVAAMLRGMGL